MIGMSKGADGTMAAKCRRAASRLMSCRSEGRAFHTALFLAEGMHMRMRPQGYRDNAREVLIPRNWGTANTLRQAASPAFGSLAGAQRW